MIKEIAFTAYPARDVAKLREWYEKNLALKFSGPYVEKGVEQYNESDLGGTCFSLMTTDWLEAPPGAGAGVVFEVADLDEAVAQLRAKGLTVEDPYITPVCKMSSLKDLEGNKVTLHQRTATAWVSSD